MASMHRLRGWLFGAGVAAALGFGGAQAFASPAPAAAGERVCNSQLCNRICQSIGTIGGFCTSDGSCVCYLGG